MPALIAFNAFVAKPLHEPRREPLKQPLLRADSVTFRADYFSQDLIPDFVRGYDAQQQQADFQLHLSLGGQVFMGNQRNKQVRRKKEAIKKETATD